MEMHEFHLVVAREASYHRDYSTALRYYRKAAAAQPLTGAAAVGYGWVLYRTLRLTTGQAPLSVTRGLLEDYAQLALPTPSVLHSRVLRTLLSLALEADFDFIKMVEWWDLSNLMEEDFETEATPDATRRRLSLAERTYDALCRRHLANRDPAALYDFLPRLDAWIAQHPAFVRLPYQRARIKLFLGFDLVEVREDLIALLRIQPQDHRAWHLLAQTLGKGTNLRLACLCRALTIAPPPAAPRQVHLDLAEALADRQWWAAAGCELVGYAKESARRDKPEAMRARVLYERVVRTGVALAPDNDALYQTYAARADELLFPPQLHASAAVVTYVDVSQRRVFLTLADELTTLCWISEDKPLPQPGDSWQVIWSEREGQRVKAHKARPAPEGETLPPTLLRTFEGTLHRLPSGHALVSPDVFVSVELLGTADLPADAAVVTGRAVRSYEARKDRWGWTALDVRAVPEPPRVPMPGTDRPRRLSLALRAPRMVRQLVGSSADRDLSAHE